ncbi:dTDP-glucose 4,6-dehydratase [Fodinibius salsisoli]|uniref:dTDP-glucose 4,6-dehydratase n=1 Tax=Fodinibius salsisoli TaxID=2820877 RepID=A0ABT3PIY7_9BACT|nr:dTDP-glucose 4,6-dehydratase [Fodinibius salsisoli]MCW9705903.1 dTDP-glucose 4,6-dehydratase [Fodinibius salsisoli]
MNIIVTGGAGFIGSNLLCYLYEKYPDAHFLNIDKLGYASDLSYLNSIRNSNRYTFKKMDIVDREAVRDIIRTYKPDGVFHLAAESHVDNSIKGPEPFIQSNVVGTFNLIEECRQFWKQDDNSWKPHRFLHVSTDEVYGELGDEGAFSEESPYAPNSPYSASKASSDFIVRSYFHTYGMDVVTTNCSNNFGPHQHDEKLIPTVIRTALKGEDIPVYGKGENVRDWLYVRDHCRALEVVYKEGKAGETYVIGGDNEWKNIELVRQICTILNQEAPQQSIGDYQNLITFVTDRPGHDFRYAIDASKIKRKLGWSPEDAFSERLTETIDWYIERYQ